MQEPEVFQPVVVQTAKNDEAGRREIAMPVLDAKALKSDRKGLAFLKAVLRNHSTDKANPVKSDPHPQSRPATAAPPQLNR